MTSFDFDVIGDSPKAAREPAQKPPAEQKPASVEKKPDVPVSADKAA